MTLRRRQKQRYIAFLCRRDPEATMVLLETHMRNLFGTISLNNASLKLVSSTNHCTILRCSLQSIENLFCAACLGNPAILSLGSSGSLNMLKKKQSQFELLLDPDL
jgi:RNase P/RNase MRP subunit POP5